MKGTSGMRTRMAHASFAPLEISVRDSRSIQMRTTANGWRKQRSSSTSFFMVPNLGHAPAGIRPATTTGWPRTPQTAPTGHVPDGVNPARPRTAPTPHVPGGAGIAWSLRCHWNADANRHAEPARPQPGLARPADAALPGPAAGRAGPRRGRDRDGRAPGRSAGPGAFPALLRSVVSAGRFPARRPGRAAGKPAGGTDSPDAQHHPPRLRPRLPDV